MNTTVEAPQAEVMPPVSPWEVLPEGDYAISELMGHTVLVGRVTEVERFGCKMAAIEVLFNGALLEPVFQGGASFYRVTPCSREVAWQRQHTPRGYYNLPIVIQAIIPKAMLPQQVTPLDREHIAPRAFQVEEVDDGRSPNTPTSA